MAKTKIQWADFTWNPWRGCQKVALGCANCYAETLSKRNPGTLGIWGSEASGATRVVAAERYWQEPFQWEKRYPGSRVFCASLADVFEDWSGPVISHLGQRLTASWLGELRDGKAPDALLTLDGVRKRVFATMSRTPRLTWMLLTKRPERAAELLKQGPWLPNRWLYASVAVQQDVEHALPHLRRARKHVAVIGLSAEPLIGPLDLTGHLADLDHVIVGGESGPGARRCDRDWIASIVDQCRDAGVPVFVKQMGSNLHWQGDVVQYQHPKGGDPSEWPTDLRVLELP